MKKAATPGGMVVLNTTFTPLDMILFTVALYSLWSTGKYSSPTTSPPLASITLRAYLFSVCGHT